jgi:tetratricopeptide (TPR) repeat protein
MKYLKTVLFLLICHLNLFAQNDSITIPDSIDQQTNDSLRMEFFLEKSLKRYSLSIKQRATYLVFAKAIAEEKKYKTKLYAILGRLGDFYDSIHKEDTAVLYYKQAIQLKEVENLAINDTIYAKCHNALSGTLQNSIDNLETSHRAPLEMALIHSKISVKLCPHFNNAWLLLGNAHILLANALIKEARSTDSETKNTLLQTALLGFEDAIIAYNQVVKLRPNHPDINRNFSILYRDRGELLGKYLGQLDAAILSLEASLEYRDDFDTFRLLGVSNGIKGVQLQSEGLADKSKEAHGLAIFYLKKALEIKPDRVPILYNLQVAHLQIGAYEKAEEYKAKWKAIDPDYNR